jgi:hypothetical protein
MAAPRPLQAHVRAASLTRDAAPSPGATGSPCGPSRLAAGSGPE